MLMIMTFLVRSGRFGFGDQILTEFCPSFVNADSMADDLGRAPGCVGEFAPLHPRVLESRHTVY